MGRSMEDWCLVGFFNLYSSSSSKAQKSPKSLPLNRKQEISFCTERKMKAKMTTTA